MLFTGILERRRMGVSQRSLALGPYWRNCSKRPKRSRNSVWQNRDNTHLKNRRNSRKSKGKGRRRRTAAKSLDSTRRADQKSQTLMTRMSLSQRRRRRRKRLAQVCACINSHVETKLGNIFISYTSYDRCYDMMTFHYTVPFKEPSWHTWPILSGD